MAQRKPNLVCPYTGSLMVVAHCDDLRAPGFYLTGGFDPSVPFLSELDAHAALRTRKGKPEAVKQLACPYTGKALKVLVRRGRSADLWYICGGAFSPTTKYDFEEDLLYAASFRGGRKPGFPKPERASIVVAEDFSDQSDPTEGFGAASAELEPGIKMLLGD